MLRYKATETNKKSIYDRSRRVPDLGGPWGAFAVYVIIIYNYFAGKLENFYFTEGLKKFYIQIAGVLHNTLFHRTK